MRLGEALKIYKTIVENGPLGTRLKYDYGLDLTFDITERKDGRSALNKIYQDDLKIALNSNIPIILNAATFRLSKNHLHNSKFDTSQDIKQINMNYINFVKQIRDSYLPTTVPIFIGAPLGSMYDAYNADLRPSVQEAIVYHQEQLSIFKGAEIDFVNVVTIPSLSEALGIATVAAQNDNDYTIGFILNKQGRLLDGTKFDEAINYIDGIITKPPLGYLITCTHTSIIMQLLKSPEKYKRLIGIQPNGSSLSLKKLDTVNKPLADTPEEFTNALIYLKERLNLIIIGGCCGTTTAHLRCIIETCSANKI